MSFNLPSIIGNTQQAATDQIAALSVPDQIGALSAGLGVVVCEWGKANLDQTKEFITVIPEDKISDLEFVESEIIKNREYSINHRQEILEYSKQFDWKQILQTHYIPSITKVIEQHG